MKHNIYNTLLLVFLASAFSVSAQFKGGAGKGNTVATAGNAALGRNIFIGGVNDGESVAVASNQPLGRNIFLGGVNDGHSFSLAGNQPLGRNIFKGGIDDGNAVSAAGNQPLGRNIFRGGADDGNAVRTASNQPLGRNIFFGGANDGWAMAMGNASLNAPLPIELLSFSGRWQQDDGLLSWQTATEINSSHFELQRSFDGNSFTAIGRVTAAGQSSAVLTYQYLDSNVKSHLPAGPSLIYYRLRSVDKDAKASYSGIVILRADRGLLTQYSLYPNPARDRVTITTSDATAAVTTIIYLTDVSGRLLLQQQMTASRQQVNVSALPNGTYFLQLTTAGKIVYTQKLIITK